MSEEKLCPKCNAPMVPGTLQTTGNYGSSPFVWAPRDGIPFPVKGVASKRLSMVVYRCEKCSYIEFYAPVSSE